jgi:hypothetical protein
MIKFFLICILFLFSCAKEDPCNKLCDNCFGVEQCEECYENCYKSLDE